MGISIWQLVIVLVIVVLLFGTKKLGNIGADLGSAIKGFKSSMKAGGEQPEGEVIEETVQLEESASATNDDSVVEEHRDRA